MTNAISQFFSTTFKDFSITNTAYRIFTSPFGQAVAAQLFINRFATSSYDEYGRVQGNYLTETMETVRTTVKEAGESVLKDSPTIILATGLALGVQYLRPTYFPGGWDASIKVTGFVGVVFLAKSALTPFLERRLPIERKSVEIEVKTKKKQRQLKPPAAQPSGNPAVAQSTTAAAATQPAAASPAAQPSGNPAVAQPTTAAPAPQPAAAAPPAKQPDEYVEVEVEVVKKEEKYIDSLPSVLRRQLALHTIPLALVGLGAYYYNYPLRDRCLALTLGTFTASKVLSWASNKVLTHPTVEKGLASWS